MEPGALVVTGGFLHAGERSALRALRREWAHRRHSGGSWYDTKVKLVTAEPILLAKREARRASPGVRAMLAPPEEAAPPELTEVVLATLLAAEAMPYALATVDDILDAPAELEERLARATHVLLSSTLLRDLAEVEALVARLKRPHNRIIVGGALASAIHARFQGLQDVDVLAVGEGEQLLPELCRWMREGGEPAAPAGGTAELRGPTLVLRAPPPASLSLDGNARPDWARSTRDRARRYTTIHYESVRGCPYRCAFCNYPYLFADDRFRTRSAERMADDWERYVAELGVTHISCLDSLFTMPKKRLVEFCEALLARGVRVRWTCYARADDLADPALVRLMRDAGAALVHIGIESGDDGQLQRMAKRTTAKLNAEAIANCREAGITTFATLVVGFPGETDASVERTMDFLRSSPPDFHFITALNTRIEAVPVLRPEERARTGLVSESQPRTTAPAWRHDSMDCVEAMGHVRALNARLAQEEVSLDAAVFYPAILRYEASMRGELLAFQRRAYGRRGTRRVLGWLNAAVDRRARREVARLAPARGEVAA